MENRVTGGEAVPISDVVNAMFEGTGMAVVMRGVNEWFKRPERQPGNAADFIPCAVGALETEIDRAMREATRNGDIDKAKQYAEVLDRINRAWAAWQGAFNA